MRAELLALLSNADLSFSPGGTNLPWGALLRELGELEASYIQALQTFRQDFSAHATDVGVERDLTRLTAWFDALDAELRATLAAFAEADWRKRVVRRGAPSTVAREVDHYGEALLIFFGKATIYLKAMNRPVPASIVQTIG
jgi:hypothetical protein